MREDPRVTLARTWSMGATLGKVGLHDFTRAKGENYGPCPRCGGDDRFSVNLRKGVFRCRICNPRGGDHIALIQHVLSCDFMAAVAYLEGDAPVAIDPEELRRREERRAHDRKRQEREAEIFRARAIEEAQGIWRRAVPFRGTQAEEYLRLRGLDLAALPYPFKCLRYIADHPYRKFIKGRWHVLHSGPALIAAIQAPDRRLTAIHQTWIDLDQAKGKAVIPPHPVTGKPLASKTVRGSKKGGAIRLLGDPPGAALVVGEGIETTGTALAADAVPGASYWVGVDLGNMAGREESPGVPDLSDDLAFRPPEHVKRLILIKDGDSNPAATDAALTACIRRAKHYSPALRGFVVDPGAGLDLNDLVNER